MITVTKPFLSTRCEALDFRNAEKQHQYIADDEQERTGYTLIGDSLVPESFIERVLWQMGSTYYTYGTVLKKEHMFLQYFLDSLTTDELEVLMPVAMELMARGKFPLDLAPETDMGKHVRESARNYGGR
jgi:hypothetical protein